MSFSFKNNFDKNNSKKNSLPDSIVDELSTKLPSGLFYQKIDSSTLALSSKENINVDVKLLPDNEMLEILGDKYNMDDVLKLMFNSQRAVNIETKNGKVVVNNNLIDVDLIIFSAETESKGAKLYLLPPKFDEIKPLVIDDGKYKLEIPIKRVPNLSLDEIKIEGDNSYFFVKLFINEKTKKLNFTINYDLSKCDSVLEIVTCLNLYQNLALGKCTVGGRHLNLSGNVKLNDVDMNRLNFWNKVYTIENKLNLCFKPSFNINGSIYRDVLEIYYSLCEGKILRKKINISNLEFKKIEDKTIKDYEDMNGKTLNFFFCSKREISLFDCSKTLYVYNYLCNVVVTNIVDSGKQFNISFDTKADSIYSIKYYDNLETVKQPDDDVMKLVNVSKTIEELEEINE